MDVLEQMRMVAGVRVAYDRTLGIRRFVSPNALAGAEAVLSDTRKKAMTLHPGAAALSPIVAAGWGRSAADVFAQLNRTASVFGQLNRVQESMNRFIKPFDQQTKWVSGVVKPWGEFVPKVGTYPRLGELFDAAHRAAVKHEVARAVTSIMPIRSDRGLLGGAAVSLHDTTSVSTVPTWTVSNDVGMRLSAVPRGPSDAFSTPDIEGLLVAA